MYSYTAPVNGNSFIIRLLAVSLLYFTHKRDTRQLLLMRGGPFEILICYDVCRL